MCIRDSLYTGSDQARRMLIAFTDWMIDITSGLSDQQIQDMLRSEHGGLNEMCIRDSAYLSGETTSQPSGVKDNWRKCSTIN